MTQKNFFNTEPATVTRNVVGSDLPWTETLDDFIQFSGTTGTPVSKTIVGGMAQVVVDSVTNRTGGITSGGGYLREDCEFQFDMYVDAYSQASSLDSYIGLGAPTNSNAQGDMYLGLRYNGANQQWSHQLKVRNGAWSIMYDGNITIGALSTGSKLTYKMVRSGKVISGYVSIDDAAFTQIGSSYNASWLPDNYYTQGFQLRSYLGASACSSTVRYDNFKITSSSSPNGGTPISGWSDDFGNPLSSAKLYDKFEGGLSQTSLTAPYVDDFSTDPATDSKYTTNYNGNATYNSGNTSVDWITDASAGKYFALYPNVRHSGNFEVRYDVTLNSLCTSTSLEFKILQADGNNYVRYYISNIPGWNWYRRTVIDAGALSGANVMQAGTPGRYQVRLRLENKVAICDWRAWDGTTGGAWSTPSLSSFDFSASSMYQNDWYTQVYAIDWGTPTGTNDVELHGIEQTSGSLDLQVPILNNEAPTENWWKLGTGDVNLVVKDNALRSTFPNDNALYSDAISSRFSLQGDYDIQCDYAYTTLTTPTTSNCNPISMRTTSSDGSNYIVYYRNSVGQDGYASQGPDATYTGPFTTDTSGTVRLTRVSGEVRAFYWNNTLARFEFDGDVNGRVVANSSTINHGINISMRQADNGHVESALTNFIVNSCDDIVWPGGTLKRFVEQTGTTYTENFTGINGDSPRQYYWYSVDPEWTIQSNQLHIAPPPNSSGGDISYEFRQTPRLQGDFVIEVNASVQQSVGDTALVLGSWAAASTSYIALRARAVSPYISFRNVNNTFINETIAYTSSGTFKYERIGGTVYQYWNDVLYSTDVNFGTADIYFWMYLLDGDGASGTTADVDWFKITSADSVNWNGAGDWVPTYMNRNLYSYNPFELSDLPASVDFTGGRDTKYLSESQASQLVTFDKAVDGLDIGYVFDNTTSNQLFNTRFTWSPSQAWEIRVKYKDVNPQVATNAKNSFILEVMGTDWTTQAVVRLGNYSSSLQGEGGYLTTSASAGNLNVLRDFNNTGGYLRFVFNGTTTLTVYHTPDGGSETVFGTTNSWSSTADMIFRGYVWGGTGNSETATMTIEDITLQSAGSITWDAVANTDVWSDSIVKSFVEQTGTTFTETFSDDTINPYFWSSINANPRPIISSNKLKISADAGYTEGIRSEFLLTGAFDFQIDYDITDVAVTETTSYFNFRIFTTDGANLIYYVYPNGSDYLMNAQRSGLGTEGGVTSFPTTGKLRIIRQVNNTIDLQYWNGASWTIYKTGILAMVGDCYFTIYHTGTTPMYALVDNIAINSTDSIIWDGVGDWNYVGNI